MRSMRGNLVSRCVFGILIFFVFLMTSAPQASAQNSIFTWFASLVRGINNRFILWNGSTFPISYLDRDAKLVAGGEYVSTRTNAQHVVRVVVEYPGGRRVLCSGSLVNPLYVLTAAHCLKNGESISQATWDKISTVAGDLEVYRREDGESVRGVKKAHLHAGYDPATRANDLALLELESGHALRAGFVALARLPTVGLNDRPEANATLLTFGWNINYNNGDQGPRVGLKEGLFDVLPPESCARGTLGSKLHEDTICLSSRDRRSCFGEDGGPVMGREPGALGGYSVLVAVNSYAEYWFDDVGQLSCNGTAPARATLVAPALDWLTAIVNSQGSTENGAAFPSSRQ